MKPQTMAIGATALVVVAGLIAILVSGDSSDSNPAPPPSLAAVTQPDLSAIAPADAGAGTVPGDASSPKGKTGSGLAGQSLATALPEGPSCPSNWTKKHCRAVGQAHKEGLGKSQAIPDGQCPSNWSKELCRSNAQAAKQAQGASHEVGPNECPLPTQQMCEEAGRQNQQAGVNPFK
jgi:hypothetical protein